MRRLLALVPAAGLLALLGCGPQTPTEYTGPEPVRVTGKNAVGNYGPPGEGPPAGGPKGPPKPPGGN